MEQRCNFGHLICGALKAELLFAERPHSTHARSPSHTSPDKATGGADDGAVGFGGLPPCGLLLLRAAGGGGAARARARTFAAATAAESALNFVGIAMSVDAASTGGSTGTDGRAERPAAAAGTAALAGGALANTRSKAGRTALAPTKSSRLPRSTQ